ncbi:helix-turn-helix transcriptional regulator [Loigolactobacillus coryniformis]|uniref:helix-turn-helix transcriptional regulator n=1 Tax=Loigolactobacillus coryniformis TaxID=1610 RepID=UPI0009D76480
MKKLSYLEASRNIGISKQAYWSVETGRRNPSVKTAKAIAGYFGFDWTKFF